jgi:hypothetical protein
MGRSEVPRSVVKWSEVWLGEVLNGKKLSAYKRSGVKWFNKVLNGVK